MKKYAIPELLNLLGMPALTVVLGAVLLFSPDTASALVGKILGWLCVLGALGFAFGSRSGDSRRGSAGGILLGVLGVWMLTNPLFPAKILGRVLGLFLLLRGIRELRLHLPQNGKFSLKAGLVLPAAAALMGLVLMLSPLATSRLLFSIVGIVLICFGLAEGYDRLQGRKRLEQSGNPDIIDVEKL